MDAYDIPESELAEDSPNVGAHSPVFDVQTASGDTASLLPSRMSFESDSLSPVPPTEVNSEADPNGKVDEDLQILGNGSPVSDLQAENTALPFPLRMSFGSDSFTPIPPAEVNSEENEADPNRTTEEDLQSLGAVVSYQPQTLPQSVGSPHTQTEYQQVPQLYQQPNQQPVQQAQLQPLHTDPVVQTQPQPQLGSPHTQPEPRPQVQPQPIPQQQVGVQPQLIPRQIEAQPQLIPQQVEVQPHLEVQPQPIPQQQSQPQPKPISGPPPYPYDPSYTYADQNTQAWASYYAQGGTDPTGSVYFKSVPGVKEATTSFVQQPQKLQTDYDLAQKRPGEEQTLAPGSPVSDAQAEDKALPFPFRMPSDSDSPGPPAEVNYEENEADSNGTNLQSNDLSPAFDDVPFVEPGANDSKAGNDLPAPQFPPPIPSPQDTVPPPVYSSSGSSGDTRVERLGEELSSDSGVWPTYVATAAAFDAEMLDGWNKGLDVLIIFASLFSAVVTAFVIESSKDLQPDYLQINALLMAHTLKALNDPHNSSYLPNLPSPEEILAFEKPLLAKMVNTFWYAALGFSLSGVLITMLAKQWLVSYGSQPQDEPHKTSCQRQRKYDTLYRWSVPWMLALLPALLHTALFLFLIGLIIYLWQLDSIVSVTTCVILGILGIFYFASGALAAFRFDCPYETPVSQFIRSFFLLRNNHHIQPDISKDLSSRAAMWLATTKNPKTVSTALQSLAGLPRGFRDYDAEQTRHLAKLSLEQFRGCFIPEWRNGDVYTLRTECQYEASCYCRTLMHLVDNPRVDPNMVSSILDDPALPVFIQLLALCSDHSISLLAMCDNQRLLHQIEFRRWNSALSSEGDHDLPTAAKMVRSAPSQENMKKIVMKLNNYLKDLIFLHPYAIEIAVETIGFAPLSWTSSVFTKDPPLTDIVKPLVKLLGATRGSFFGVRHATARTFSILARIHEISRMEDPVADFALRFDSALVIVKELEGVHSSDWQARNMLLSALSHFVVAFEEEGISTVEICEELFHECDKRFGDEMHMFVDEAAITTLLPLLRINTLKPDLKARIVRSLHDNAISAVQTFSLPDDGTVIPAIPFPPETVSILLKTLDAFKDSSHSWLRDLSTSIYLVTRSPIHRQHLLAESGHIISLISSVEQEEIASHLFLILSDSAHKVIMAETEPELLPNLVNAGVLDMLKKYCIKPGLTPADVQMWVTILFLLDSELPNVAKSSVEVREHMLAHFRAQTAERTTKLIELQEPLLQFSFQSPSSYTPESALETLGIFVSGISKRHVTGSKEDVNVNPDHEK